MLDAIRKRAYKLAFNMSHEEVDRMPTWLMDIWDKIAMEEKNKKGVS
jgi:hypothetical protein